MSKNTVERFSNRVENYVKYRPSYPKEVLDLFRDEMNFDKDSKIADIGSGTGISTKLFLENGNEVFGVEPNEAMREAAEEFLKEFSKFKSVNGTAENTTLSENSIDFIIAAQAFHWFDQEKTRQEFKRILKNKGFIALIWNERQLDTNDFLKDYEKILIEFGTDYEQVRHENIKINDFNDAFQTEFSHSTFDNIQTLNFEGMKGRILSSSYMPSPEHPRFDELIKNLKTLFAEHQKNGKIQVLYDTNIFYSQY